MSEMKKKIAYSMILLYVYIRCTTAIIWKCPLLLLFLFFILPLFLCHDDDNHVFFLLLHNHNSAFALFIVAYRSKKKTPLLYGHKTSNEQPTTKGMYTLLVDCMNATLFSVALKQKKAKSQRQSDPAANKWESTKKNCNH